MDSSSYFASVIIILACLFVIGVVVMLVASIFAIRRHARDTARELRRIRELLEASAE